MQKLRLSRWLAMLSLLALWSFTLQAQGGVLNYGDTLSEKLDVNVTQALYTFNGNAGEVITAYALGWSSDFQPTLTLLGPTGQIGFSNSDSLTPIGNDARITVRLPQAGAYSLLVGSASTVFNTYTLTLQLNAPIVSAVLGDAPTELAIPPAAPQQSYSLPMTSTPYSVRVEGSDGFAYSATVRDATGNVVATVSGALPSFSFTVPAGTGTYELLVAGADATQTGTLRIIRDGAGATPPPTSDGQTGTTGTVQVPADICAIFAGPNGVNLRGGPGTNYNTVGSLIGQDYLTATGQYNGWYYGTYRGQTAWVAASVTTAQGASCATLPVVEPPPPPAQPVQPATTEEPTGDNTQPTPTTDPNTGTQPTQAPPTATTAADTGAPIDADQLNWELNRDAGGQYSNSVSSPTGDTTDRIRITVAELFNQPPNNTRRFNITMVCTGTGTENLRWGTGGPSSPANLVCGGSVSIFHTNDSNQTFLNVNMQGDGNVNYTLVATRTDN
jgi:hypothetical protein